MPAIKHPDYFLDTIIFSVCGNDLLYGGAIKIFILVWQVEGCLFKVPKYHFVRSATIFPVSLDQPQEEVLNAEGYSEESPIFLPGTTKADFESLMKILYPL